MRKYAFGIDIYSNMLFSIVPNFFLNYPDQMLEMEKQLMHKNILVTGASRGIGRAIAVQLASEGANIAVHYYTHKDAAFEVRELCGKKAILVQADLCKKNEIDSLFKEVIDQFNSLHVLVNNAGIAISSDPSGGDDEWMNDWSKTMNINLNATAYLCKKTVTHFIQNSIKGRIINISSRAAFRGDTKDYLAYAASKGGMVSLTRSLARAYGRHGIIAFDIAPGFVKTDMAKQFIDTYGVEYVMQDMALDTITTPEDVANFVSFLASGKADHATGCSFDINAGSYFH